MEYAMWLAERKYLHPRAIRMRPISCPVFFLGVFLVHLSGAVVCTTSHWVVHMQVSKLPNFLVSNCFCVLQSCARKSELGKFWLPFRISILFSLLLSDTNATLLYCMEGFFELSLVLQTCSITFTCKFKYCIRLFLLWLQEEIIVVSLLVLCWLGLSYLCSWFSFPVRRMWLGFLVSFFRNYLFFR